MSRLASDENVFSSKRLALCSRENALRVASRLCDATLAKVSVIRTEDPFQPYRVSTAPKLVEYVELEMMV